LTRSITVPAGGAVTTTVSEAPVEPPEFDAVRVTVYEPGAVNVCDGFRIVLVPPSPNDHDHDVGDPVEVSVNDTASGARPEVVEAVNDAVGAGTTGASTTTVVEALVEPPEFDAVRVTVYVPAAVNVCDGLCAELVPPSPNDHDHDVGDPVEVSVNETASGAVPEEADAVKDAVGAGIAGSVTTTVVDALVDPPAFDAASVTV
jgi:hypothetical protein